MDENLHPASENSTRVLLFTAAPTAPTSTQGTPQSGRGVTQPPSDPPDPDISPASPQQQHDSQNQNQELGLSSTRTPTAAQRDVEAAAAPEGEGSTRSLTEEAGGNRMEISEDSDQLPPPPEGPEPEPEQAEQTHPHPNMVELLSSHRGSCECLESVGDETRTKRKRLIFCKIIKLVRKNNVEEMFSVNEPNHFHKHLTRHVGDPQNRGCCVQCPVDPSRNCSDSNL